MTAKSEMGVSNGGGGMVSGETQFAAASEEETPADVIKMTEARKIENDLIIAGLEASAKTRKAEEDAAAKAIVVDADAVEE